MAKEEEHVARGTKSSAGSSSVGILETELEAKAVLRSSNVQGAFVLVKGKDATATTLWVNAPLMHNASGGQHRHLEGTGSDPYVVLGSRSGKCKDAFPGALEDRDVDNGIVVLSFVDSECVRKVRVPQKGFLKLNPRFSVAPLAISIHNPSPHVWFLADRVTQPSRHDSLDALLRHHMQHGVQVPSNGSSALLQLIPSPTLSTPTSPSSHPHHSLDTRLFLSHTREEAESIMTGHWVQPGDFIPRLSDPSSPEEKDSIAVLTLMQAIRVAHIHLCVTREGVFYCPEAPKAPQFALLSELVDELVRRHRFRGIPLRRIVNVSHAWSSKAPEYTYQPSSRALRPDQETLSRPVVSFPLFQPKYTSVHSVVPDVTQGDGTAAETDDSSRSYDTTFSEQESSTPPANVTSSATRKQSTDSALVGSSHTTSRAESDSDLDIQELLDMPDDCPLLLPSTHGFSYTTPSSSPTSRRSSASSHPSQRIAHSPCTKGSCFECNRADCVGCLEELAPPAIEQPTIPAAASSRSQLRTVGDAQACHSASVFGYKANLSRSGAKRKTNVTNVTVATNGTRSTTASDACLTHTLAPASCRAAMRGASPPMPKRPATTFSARATADLMAMATSAQDEIDDVFGGGEFTLSQVNHLFATC
eukprot:m.97057 g.97057  ORF g.97057 m.97057 type:complete len:645 (+) comp13091_c0_seq4:1998-3932(+)